MRVFHHCHYQYLFYFSVRILVFGSRIEGIHTYRETKSRAWQMWLIKCIFGTCSMHLSFHAIILITRKTPPLKIKYLNCFLHALSVVCNESFVSFSLAQTVTWNFCTGMNVPLSIFDHIFWFICSFFINVMHSNFGYYLNYSIFHLFTHQFSD